MRVQYCIGSFQYKVVQILVFQVEQECSLRICERVDHILSMLGSLLFDRREEVFYKCYPRSRSIRHFDNYNLLSKALDELSIFRSCKNELKDIHQ